MEWADHAVHIGRHDGLLVLVLVSVVAAARLGHVALGLVACLWTVFQVFMPRAEWRIFALWTAYSVIYWSLGVAVEELPVFLVLTTVAQVAIVVLHYAFSHALERNPALSVALSLLLILPIHCNNALYAPILGLLRVALYMIVRHERGATWMLEQYPLFAKSEILPFLLVVHLVSKRYARPAEPVVPLLPVHGPPLPAHEPLLPAPEPLLPAPEPLLPGHGDRQPAAKVKLRPFYENKRQ